MAKNTWSVVAVALVATLGVAASPPLPDPLEDPSADWVRAGSVALAAGRTTDAIELGLAASSRDPTDPVAHQLVAKGLSTLRVQHPDQVCAWNAWPDVILDHVAAARALDPGVGRELLDDPMVGQALSNSLERRAWVQGQRIYRRSTVRVSQAVRAGVTLPRTTGTLKPRWVATWLTTTRFFGLGPDGSHDDSELRLDEGGRAVLARVVRDADRTKHAMYTVGSWSIVEGGVRVSLDGVATDLVLTVDGLADDGGRVRYRDQPVDCTRPFDIWADLPAE